MFHTNKFHESLINSLGVSHSLTMNSISFISTCMFYQQNTNNIISVWPHYETDGSEMKQQNILCVSAYFNINIWWLLYFLTTYTRFKRIKNKCQPILSCVISAWKTWHKVHGWNLYEFRQRGHEPIKTYTT